MFAYRISALLAGYISRENLREFLGKNAESEITEIIESADVDKDGKSKLKASILIVVLIGKIKKGSRDQIFALLVQMEQSHIVNFWMLFESKSWAEASTCRKKKMFAIQRH